ncbi:MAG: hypothetical protein KHF84_00945 [Thermoplasmata archaeon]|nr:hypothetical protein [Candidatus Sysuiplasma jiujiangense]MBX8639475.1 hypothetical protein [Candidatus Sysuiplasma jiujiangense]
MKKEEKMVAGFFAVVIVAIAVVLAFIPFGTAPHFAFPSVQSVNSAAGTSYSSQKLNTTVLSGSITPSLSVVRAESTNYTSGSNYIRITIVLYNTSSEAQTAYDSINSSIGELHSFLPTSHYVYSAYKSYRYAFIILPHNSTISGFSSVLGFSFAVSHLGHYVYIVFSDFGGMNTAKLSNLVDLQTNTMTSGPLI